jgi:hypothetical protein
MIHEEKIEKAVENLIDSWDMETLVNFAIEDREHYYLNLANKEEVESLLQDFGNKE